MKRVAIVGGGASGLMCAIVCAKNGCSVDIFEQNSKIGKKILVSGNGKCNITNKFLNKDDYHSNNSEFVEYALKKFGFYEFKKFVESFGLLLHTKDDGKCYPFSFEAKNVVFLLQNYASKLGVKFHTDIKVKDIKALFTNYNSVVIATGSEASPHLGGCSDGLEFAKEFGHNIIPTYPSLVQLELNSKTAPKMSGVKLNAEVTLFLNYQKELSISGDILFTNYGISGLAILDISQKVSVALQNYEMVDISLNILPTFTQQQLSAYILNSYKQNGFTLKTILYSLLPTKVVNVIADEFNTTKIDTKLSKNIANKLQNIKFEVTKTRGFRYAEVAGGGVDITQINPKTMESLKKENLYFIGEVLDIVGKRGGYNLAWAWASGYVCAKAISST